MDLSCGKMHTSIVSIAVLVLIALVSGAPFDDDSLISTGQKELDVIEDSAFLATEEDNEQLGVRHRRVTCDLLSPSTPWVTLNHSACAAHCLAMRKGFRGGRCIDGVCHCRK